MKRLLIVLAALLAFTLALAQVLGPGEFSTLLVEGASTFGSGAASDVVLNFDADTADATLTWDNGDVLFVFNSAIRVYQSGPAFSLRDPNTSATLDSFQFIAHAIDTTSSDEETGGRMTVLSNGSVREAIDVGASEDGTDEEGYIKFYLNGSTGNEAVMTYNGPTDGYGFRFDGDPAFWEFDATLKVDVTSGVIQMISPDGTCSNCSVDNADAWSCASATCL